MRLTSRSTQDVFIRASALCFALAFGACATINEDLWQTISLRTVGAPGARCTLSTPTIGELSVIAPTSIRVPRDRRAIEAHCVKECFEDGFGVINATINWREGGAGLLLGGPLSAAMDGATGAAYTYQPALEITMIPAACPKSHAPAPVDVQAQRARPTGEGALLRPE
jgi:hypothetical protein